MRAQESKTLFSSGFFRDFLDKKVGDKFCREVDEIGVVYQGWNQIVSNLTDGQLMHVDARKFSVNQFYRAPNSGWCLNYND